MDDLTISDRASIVAADVEKVTRDASVLGLMLNESKCELISPDPSFVQAGRGPFKNFVSVDQDSATLLGAPLSTGQSMDAMLELRCNDLSRAINRLGLISSHDALVMLRVSLSAPKLQYILRSSPCTDHPRLNQFDALLRQGLSVISNSNISDLNWIQASLPVKEGGLGVRSVAMLAPSAFLASAAGSLDLQTMILSGDHGRFPDHFYERTLETWKTRHNQPEPEGLAKGKQSHWDSACIKHGKEILISSASDDRTRARLLASCAPHSGDWIQALPITSCGLRLEDDAIRVAVGLRLGINLCVPHQCPCGADVDATGLHGLACRRSAGRLARHQQLNDLLWRALSRANIPAQKEPSGLSRSDGKRPDGLTLIPWRAGRSLAWDVTVIDTLAESYLTTSAQVQGGAAEIAASRKVEKYQQLSQSYTFCPVAFETLGPINEAGTSFLVDLGNRIAKVTGDKRESSFLFQRLSISIQRCNALSIRGSFVQIPEDTI